MPIFPWGDSGRLVRISAQLYNGDDDYERLVRGLLAIRDGG